MKKLLVIMLSAVMVLLLAASVMAEEAAAPQDDSLVVTVEGGQIRGSVDENGVRSYKGIPFAANAGGENRFRDPQPVEPWDGVRECTEFGPIGIQDVATSSFGKWTAEYLDVNKTEENGLMSEDCLSINVWTRAEEGDKLPVIVYIHGGGNSSGSSSCEIYTGEKLALKNVVYVSFNYRLGEFGGLVFTDKNGETATGNFGLKDQIAALTWVQNNIEAFGGDPSNVTIAGQSAGSADCQTLMISPKAAGLFQHAVCMSALSYPGGFKTAEDAQADVAETLADYTLEDLRSMSAQEIRALGLNTSFFTLDGEYLTQSAAEAYATGNYNLCDVMWGCVREDGTIIGYMNPSIVAETYDQGVASVFKDSLDTYESLYPVENGDYEGVIAEVNAAAEAYKYYDAAVAKLAGDADHKNYVYYFDHVIPDTQERMEAYGAFHTSDVSYWTNYYSNSYPRDWQDVDYQLGDTMSSYLVNFATTGDPNGEGLPTWTSVNDAEGLSYMHLGETVEFVNVEPERAEFWDDTFGDGASVGSASLEAFTEVPSEISDEYTRVQTYEVKTGKFPGTPMTAYSNDEGNKLCFEFSLFGDDFVMKAEVEDGEVTYVFDKSGFFGADVLDFIADIDDNAWEAR